MTLTSTRARILSLAAAAAAAALAPASTLEAQFVPGTLGLGASTDGTNYSDQPPDGSWFMLKCTASKFEAGVWYAPVCEITPVETYESDPGAIEGMDKAPAEAFSAFLDDVLDDYGYGSQNGYGSKPALEVPTLDAGAFLVRAMDLDSALVRNDRVVEVAQPLYLQDPIDAEFGLYPDDWDADTRARWSDHADGTAFTFDASAQTWTWEKVQRSGAGFSTPGEFFNDAAWQVMTDHGMYFDAQLIGLRGGNVLWQDVPTGPDIGPPPVLDEHPVVTPKFTISPPIRITYVGTGATDGAKPQASFRAPWKMGVPEQIKAAPGSQVVIRMAGYRKGMMLRLRHDTTGLKYNVIVSWAGFGLINVKLPAAVTDGKLFVEEYRHLIRKRLPNGTLGVGYAFGPFYQIPLTQQLRIKIQ